MSKSHARISPAWSRMRQCHLAVYPECRACGSEDDTCVHHLRYRGKRGHSEQPGDLVTLCRRCHDELHRTHRGGSLVVHTLAFIREVATTTT